MSYLLCSGVERRSVWFTQMLVIITNLFVLIAFCTGLGLGCSALMFPGDLDIGALFGFKFRSFHFTVNINRNLLYVFLYF